ncbi:ribokinase [Vannielia litorea]|uniref:ribokinase n=1 Tax=Vannielia litorea TaxID=1217970 RepID=UPI001C954E79|nr:ribokinase [Vannielia litorea]MBY6049290.1 ribokinase [Vannielia litorea]MBY6076704.1 ribokinase [Vannielia litorea]
MTVYNFGSINRDLIHEVPHMPAPGETLAATRYSVGLGGKGANQSVACAQAGAMTVHIGAVGKNDSWATGQLERFGVDISQIRRVESETGHAVIYVDATGENSIVIQHGANAQQSLESVEAALSGAVAGDILMLQNETPFTEETAKLGRNRDLFVIYSAAPFEPHSVSVMLPYIDLLVMNRGECEELERRNQMPLADIPVPHVLVTLGADGAIWRDQSDGSVTHVAARKVEAVDTTGAGDCFTGVIAAALSEGKSHKQALEMATAAASIQVTRPGAAPAMPSRDEIDAAL